jgi:probable HAF family extracellular repeat protein
MCHFSFRLSLNVCFAVLISHIALAQTYTVLDLGVLPRGSYSIATGINASGQVTGSSDIGTRDSHAFLFSNGTMQDLGTLGGKASRGIAINAAGQVLGWSYINDTITVHPFLFSGGSMQDLGIAATARAMNDFGQVTGHLGSPEHAFLFSNGTMYDLGTPPGFTSTTGYGINNSGQVTGEAYFAAYYHAFLYSNGTMQDLGTLPGGYSSGGRAINNSGQVTGTSAVYGGYYHAFIYSNGTMQDLGTLPGGQYSAASAINNYGQVTGYAVNSTGSSDARAFLYSNGTMQDLNDLISPTSGWTLSVGTGINDAGQITGDGILDGRQHAFLLTTCPHEGCPVVVPDVTPPWITLFATPKILRPPNGQMVPVTIWGTITDHESGVFARSVEYAVTDDYHRVQPSGHMTLDPTGNYFFTILLQASHDPDDQNGRRYTIRVNARDYAGYRAAKWQAVTVP